MIAATHISIGVSAAIVLGLSPIEVSLVAAGSLLPDLDTTKSAAGTVLLPISIPLSSWLGHRGAFHSFWLWSIVTLAGLAWRPLYWIGGGALVHVFADCATVSGVRALTPFSSKIFVFFKRSWRVKTGSGGEFMIMMLFGLFAMSAYSISSMGGLSTFLGYITGSPKIGLEEFKRQGLKICTVKGTFRWESGKIEKVEWLIIGTEGRSGLAFFNGEKIIRQPKNGSFSKMFVKTSDKQWSAAKLKGWRVTENDAYFMSGGRWYKASKGDVVLGEVISEKLILADL